VFWGFTIWTEKEKDSRHFTLSELDVLTAEEFAAVIRENQSSSALLFVHGFNTDFNAAIFRLAQIVWDAQFPGVPVAFSWPSRGEITDYDYDWHSASFSRPAFSRVLYFLQYIAAVSKIYVVAHSMGSHIVTEVLSQDVSNVKIPLTEVVLAAPDVDRDVFVSLSDQLDNVANGITLYASSADKALLASKAKAGWMARAGYVDPSSGPLVLPGIETIDVTAVGDDMFALNHDVYSSARSVIDDLGRLVTGGIHPPNVRSPQIRGVPEGSAQPRYWKYPS
jgi:esterase/lipase superfamily enzyme